MRKLNIIPVIIGVLIIAAVGVLLLRGSYADSSYIAAEPELGGLSCVFSAEDGSASSGKAIAFKACAASADSNSPLSLDRSGKTIPDTNYPIPAGSIFMATSGSDTNPGTQAAPIKSLNKAIDTVPSGGTIVTRGGIYRDGYDSGPPNYVYKIAAKKFTLQAYPHEQVWLDGTETQPAHKWTSDGAGHWYMNWSTPHFCMGRYYEYKYDAQPTNNTGPCAHWDINSPPEYPAGTDPQMVFIDDVPVREVASLSAATDNNLYYDWSNRRIYIATNPAGRRVDLAIRTNALVIGGSSSGFNGSAIKGVGIRRYATNESEQSPLTQHAVYAAQTNMTIENIVFTENASYGLYLEPVGGTMRHLAMVNNGYAAAGSNGHSQTSKNDNILIENSLFADNNTEHMGIKCSQSCGQAGLKFNHMAGCTIRNNIFTKNLNGAGFWCDQNCSKGVIVNNLAYDNDNEGIFYEISSDAIIAGNMLINNKDGIGLASATTKIYNNTMINNRRSSIHVYDDDRWSGDRRGTDLGPDNYGIDIKNNVQYGGSVFTMYAERKSSTGSNTGPNTYFSGLDYNSYYRAEGTSRNVIHWTDGSAKGYSSLTAFRADHPAWEQHGKDISGGGDPFFTNLPAGDYTIRTNSVASKSGTALPADVAAVLKVSTNTGQDMGAFNWPGKK